MTEASFSQRGLRMGVFNHSAHRSLKVLRKGSKERIPSLFIRSGLTPALKASKREAELQHKLDELSAENASLKRTLAGLQGVSIDEVAIPAAEPNQDSLPAEDNSEASVDIKHLDLESNIIWPGPDEAAAWERIPWQSPLGLSLQRASPTAIPIDESSLHIVHISAEFAPVAKVGGLGDVVTGLARLCLKRGHTVKVILPFYQCLPESCIENLQHVQDFDVPKGRSCDGRLDWGSLRTQAYSGIIDGIPVLLLRPDWAATNLFQGSRIYGGSYNETEAYLYFSRASLELLKVTEARPDILHVHEWQTAAVSMLFWEAYFPGGLASPKVVFTIHNLDCQGECRQDEFAATGVAGEVFSDIHKALDERTIGHNPERLCLMKGGMVYANAVTTVSPTYAAEALDGGAAGWLKSTLARPDIRSKFEGILNGIDTSLWDPAIDKALPAPFNQEDLRGKALCKRYLQMALRMREEPDKPLVAVITRLVPQKGVHLIKHAVYRTLEKGGQFVLLGSGHADGEFKGMAEGDLQGHPDARLLIMYSDSLAHLIYAAADVILVPSLFEPCGLTQLVGMRYGAVPVVRSTGGLADTVKDVDKGEAGNGFSFAGMDSESLNSALDRSLQRYQTDKLWWQQLVLKNMAHDSSWNSSANHYVDLYYKLRN